MALNIGLDANERLLTFGPDVAHGPEREWRLDQVRPFLENPDADGPDVVARHYPKVMRSRDARRFAAIHVEYGVMELAFGQLGMEWVTFPGHIHRGPGRALLPAVLEVIDGEAGLYLQRAGTLDRNVEASIVWIKTGDRVLLPPGYAHALINRGQRTLVAAEAHSSLTRADFTDAARRRGMGHYFGPAGSRPNPHYRTMTEVREISALSMAPPDSSGGDLYHALLKSPERFRFLHPFSS